MPGNLALLVYQGWADLDQAVAGLTPEQAAERGHGQSAIAWTVGHVSQQVDSIAAHHFLHVGEIATLRSLHGHRLPPGRGDWGRTFL